MGSSTDISRFMDRARSLAESLPDGNQHTFFQYDYPNPSSARKASAFLHHFVSEALKTGQVALSNIGTSLERQGIFLLNGKLQVQFGGNSLLAYARSDGDVSLMEEAMSHSRVAPTRAFRTGSALVNVDHNRL
jgi:hypothetical protein